MNKDSWCTVELTPSQDWMRAVRKHNKHAFDSKVLKQDFNGDSKNNGRLTNFTASDPSHKERRHFNNKYESEFKL